MLIAIACFSIKSSLISFEIHYQTSRREFSFDEKLILPRCLILFCDMNPSIHYSSRKLRNPAEILMNCLISGELSLQLATCNNENTSATICFFQVTTDQAREQLQFQGLNDGEGPLDLRGQSCMIYMVEKSF